MRKLQVRLLATLRAFRGRNDGNIAVETALVTPFVLLAIFGAIDIVRYIQVQDSVVRAVSVTADAIGRQNGLTANEVSAFLDHAAGTIDPDATGGSATMSVAAIHKDGENAPKVSWRRSEDASATEYSGTCETTGPAGGTASLPQGFTLFKDDTVVVAEACYTFAPAFLISRAIFNLDFIPLDIYGRAISAARFSTLEVLEP